MIGHGQNFHKGCHWTILVNTKQYYAMLDNIRKFLTILDNIITFLRILLQLRKERAEITPWTILNNIRQYLTILYNIEQYWTIFGKILRCLTTSSNIVSHLIPRKQTYAIPKFSLPLLLFFFSHERVLEELSLLKTTNFKICFLNKVECNYHFH